MNLLSYEEFVVCLQAKLWPRLGDYQIKDMKRSEMVKNNGVMKDTLTFEFDESCVSPVIYLKEVYEDYKSGSEIERIADHILALSGKKPPMLEEISGEWLLCSENVVNRIIMRLINYESNRELLETCPHVLFLDLAVVFRVMVSDEDKIMSSTLVTCELADRWHMDEEALLRCAMINMKLLWPEKITPLYELVKDKVDEADMEDVRNMQIFVVNNTMGMNGSTVLIYSNCINELGRALKMDLYILPSSIHELLIVPSISGYDINELREMVRCVNARYVDPEEVLSDNVYIYDYTTDDYYVAE